MYTFGSWLEFPAFKGRHFSLKVLNSPQVMHHVPFVKTLTYLHCMAEPKIISIEVIGSSGQESLRLRALEVGGRRKDEMCSILSKELLTTKVPLTFVSTRDTTKQIISMTSVSVMFALRSCETDYLTKK